ncbi:MAG: FumA C-terminus/TtdB family hydratase beta subunit [Lachnospirales bacterium]
MKKIISTPISLEDARSLNIGEVVYLTGVIYTLRDAGHKRLVELLEKGETLNVDLKGATVYYAGPCPTPPNKVIGSIGPTTSIRMDAYSPYLLKWGLKNMIGKGFRSQEVVDTVKEVEGLYLSAVGGAGALMSKCVKSVEVVAFQDLGTEALRRLEVFELPVIVSIDTKGNYIYREV